MKHRKLSLVLCDDLEGLDGGWERGSEGRDYVFIWLIHFIVHQKLMQNCKATILQ